MALSAAYNLARRDLLLVTDKDPATVPIPAGYTWKSPVKPQNTGDVWDWTALDFVAQPPQPVTEGVPSGALLYVLDPADALGMPVDVQRSTDPAPAAPKTTAPLTSQPRADFEWDGAAFSPPTRVADRLVHGLLRDLLAEAQLHQWAADNSVARTDPAAVQTQLKGLAARSWRKVRLALKGQGLVP